jgi:hypothetical protein
VQLAVLLLTMLAVRPAAGDVIYYVSATTGEQAGDVFERQDRSCLSIAAPAGLQ